MSEYLADVRAMPRRFWDTYLLALVFMAGLAFVAAQGSSVSIFFVWLVTAWGIFSGMRVAYGVGRIKAYREAQQWADDAAQALHESRANLEAAMDKLDQMATQFGGDRVQGPS